MEVHNKEETDMTITRMPRQDVGQEGHMHTCCTKRVGDIAAFLSGSKRSGRTTILI